MGPDGGAVPVVILDRLVSLWTDAPPGMWNDPHTRPLDFRVVTYWTLDKPTAAALGDRWVRPRGRIRRLLIRWAMTRKGLR